MAFQFQKLEVYNDAVGLVDAVYALTKRFPREEAFGLTNQLRRASLSISCNIAEGSSRGSKGFAHFLNIALGSCYECVPLLEVSKAQGYAQQDQCEQLFRQNHRISAKISALKNSISTKER
jgi:four helix bundle protein